MSTSCPTLEIYWGTRGKCWDWMGKVLVTEFSGDLSIFFQFIFPRFYAFHVYAAIGLVVCSALRHSDRSVVFSALCATTGIFCGFSGFFPLAKAHASVQWLVESVPSKTITDLFFLAILQGGGKSLPCGRGAGGHSSRSSSSLSSFEEMSSSEHTGARAVSSSTSTGGADETMHLLLRELDLCTSGGGDPETGGVPSVSTARRETWQLLLRRELPSELPLGLLGIHIVWPYLLLGLVCFYGGAKTEGHQINIAVPSDETSITTAWSSAGWSRGEREEQLRSPWSVRSRAERPSSLRGAGGSTSISCSKGRKKTMWWFLRGATRARPDSAAGRAPVLLAAVLVVLLLSIWSWDHYSDDQHANLATHRDANASWGDVPYRISTLLQRLEISFFDKSYVDTLQSILANQDEDEKAVVAIITTQAGAGAGGRGGSSSEDRSPPPASDVFDSFVRGRLLRSVLGEGVQIMEEDGDRGSRDEAGSSSSAGSSAAKKKSLVVGLNFTILSGPLDSYTQDEYLERMWQDSTSYVEFCKNGLAFHARYRESVPEAEPGFWQRAIGLVLCAARNIKEGGPLGQLHHDQVHGSGAEVGGRDPGRVVRAQTYVPAFFDRTARRLLVWPHWDTTAGTNYYTSLDDDHDYPNYLAEKVLSDFGLDATSGLGLEHFEQVIVYCPLYLDRILEEGLSFRAGDLILEEGPH